MERAGKGKRKEWVERVSGRGRSGKSGEGEDGGVRKGRSRKRAEVEEDWGERGRRRGRSGKSGEGKEEGVGRACKGTRKEWK